ncbi:hypothetical protein Mro03_50790 [Microbispora rosea subsp. rosea]|nr:hypothetical protein Mro03_50790 [Microbispora rosea subsp. rosea]
MINLSARQPIVILPGPGCAPPAPRLRGSCRTARSRRATAAKAAPSILTGRAAYHARTQPREKP